MAQLGEKPHGFKDLDFLMVLKKAAAGQQVISHKAAAHFADGSGLSEGRIGTACLVVCAMGCSRQQFDRFRRICGTRRHIPLRLRIRKLGEIGALYLLTDSHATSP